MHMVPRAAAPLLALFLLVLGGAVACSRVATPPSRAPGPFRAAVTIAPLKGLVAPLLPAGHQLYIVIPPGRSEHGYEFTPSDVSALSRADLVVHVGLGLEPRIERFLEINASPLRQVVCFAQAIGVEEPGASHAHQHVHDEHCDHGDLDPHLWLDPVHCASLVPHLRSAVERSLQAQGQLTEAERARLDAAERALVKEINELHAWAQERLKPFAGRAIVTHHAAWGRLADRYGLTVAAVIRPIESAEPTPAAIAGAVEAIRSRNVRAIFIEPQFNPAAARRIADAAGVSHAVLDPLGDGDWLSMMRANINTLADTLAR